MAYAVVRTDKLHGVDTRIGVCSVRYQPTVNGVATKTEIENGNVVLLNGLETGEREIYVATTPAANSNFKNIALVAAPEVMYDERLVNLDQFINVAGKAARAYRLHDGDIFSVTKEALDGVASPAIGDGVELKAGTKLNVTAAASGATQGSTVVGKIIDKNVVGKYTYYAIEVQTA